MPDLAYGEVYAMNKVQARLKLVETYIKTKSISETARIWHTSRQVVRKWVKRYQKEGEAGLRDRSRRPHKMPKKTSSEIEEKVMALRKKYRYGRKRIAQVLKLDGIEISEHTVRHILRRNLSQKERQRRKLRKAVYPAHWAWEQKRPFSLFQVDTKDIADKGTLGTKRVNHLYKRHLPRYQWTALEGKSRLRFLAYSHRLNRTNGLAFMILVLMWLRAFRVEEKVKIQSLLKIEDEAEFLSVAQKWEYVYNMLRPHQGIGMNGNPPMMVLRRLGYTGSDEIALFPVIILDEISADLLLSLCDPPGNDLLTYYIHLVGPIRGY